MAICRCDEPSCKRCLKAIGCDELQLEMVENLRMSSVSSSKSLWFWDVAWVEMGDWSCGYYMEAPSWE